MTTNNQDPDLGLTVPPLQALRFDSPAELYRHIPEVAGFAMHRPQADEDAFAFLQRLRASTTPEDAVTYAAFATQPATAIAWGGESIRLHSGRSPRGHRTTGRFRAFRPPHVQTRAAMAS